MFSCTLHVVTHIHLKANFELALHDEDDEDEGEGAEHHPQQQLGRRGARDLVPAPTTLTLVKHKTFWQLINVIMSSFTKPTMTRLDET